MWSFKADTKMEAVLFCFCIAQWKMDGNKRNLNCFYSIFAKKHNSHSHFKYIKKHKIIPRNCCVGVITLCSPKKDLFSIE